MGDSNRNVIFAQFIVKHFPKAKTILCVADGKGELAYLLAKKGKIVRVIEAYPRQEYTHKKLRYEKGIFSSKSPISEDLVVGMHPDGATEAIIKSAKANGKAFAVVPCCHVLENGGKTNVTSDGAWRNYLMGLWSGGSSSILKFSGRNIVLWRKS